MEAYKRLVTERTHYALSTEEFQKEKVSRAGEGTDASAVFNKKKKDVLREQMLSTASDFFWYPKMFQMKWCILIQQGTARK